MRWSPRRGCCWRSEKVDLAETVLRVRLWNSIPRHIGARYLFGTVLASRSHLDDAAAAFAEVLKDQSLAR